MYNGKNKMKDFVHHNSLALYLSLLKYLQVFITLTIENTIQYSIAAH